MPLIAKPTPEKRREVVVAEFDRRRGARYPRDVFPRTQDHHPRTIGDQLDNDLGERLPNEGLALRPGDPNRSAAELREIELAFAEGKRLA